MRFADLRHTLAWLALFAAAVFGSLQGNPHSGVRQVEVDEARKLMQAGALVIDVRERAAYAAAHLPGALQIPLEALPNSLATIEAAGASSIVVYCGDGSTRGLAAAHLLTQAGFVQTVNMRAGLDGWRRAGLPTRSS